MSIRTRRVPDSARRTSRAVCLATALALACALALAAAPPAGAASGSGTQARVAAPVRTAAAASTAATPFPEGYVVVIDAGHQAHADTHKEPIGPGSKTRRPKVAGGTSGVATKVHESVVNLRVALKLRDVLEADGATVVMVRTGQKVNIANSRRAKIANAAGADLFVRIHCDGTASSVHGVLMLVPKRNKWTKPIVTASARAGRDILAAVIDATGAVDRGTQIRGDLSGFNYSHVPAMLIEMGNMKNAKEDKRLSKPSYQDKLAAGIAAGVIAFANGK